MRNHKPHDPSSLFRLPGNRWCQATVAAGVVLAAATLAVARSGTEPGPWQMLAAFLGGVGVVAGGLVFREDDSSGKTTRGTYLAGAAGALVFSFLFFRLLLGHYLALDYVGEPGSACRYDINRENLGGGILGAGLVALFSLVLSLRTRNDRGFASLKSVEFMAFAGAIWLSLVGGVGLFDAVSRLDARVLCDCYSGADSTNSEKIVRVCPDVESRCRAEAEAPKPREYVECVSVMPSRPAAELVGGALVVLGITGAWAIRLRASRRRRWLADVRLDKVPGWHLTQNVPVKVNGAPTSNSTFALVSHGDADGYRDAAPPRDVSASNIPEEEVTGTPGKYTAESGLLSSTFWLLLCGTSIFFIVGYFAAVMRVGGK